MRLMMRRMNPPDIGSFVIFLNPRRFHSVWVGMVTNIPVNELVGTLAVNGDIFSNCYRLVL